MDAKKSCLEEFYLDPQKYLQNVDNGVKQICSNVKNRLVEENPEFVYKFYDKLLRIMSLSIDKTLYLEILYGIYNPDDESKSKIIQYLWESGLVDKTIKRFDMLNMKDKLREIGLDHGD